MASRLEVSRGIVEAKHVTSDRHSSSALNLTNTNSCQLKSTHMTPTNCSRITSPAPQKRNISTSETQWTQRVCPSTRRHLSFTRSKCWVFATIIAYVPRLRDKHVGGKKLELHSRRVVYRAAFCCATPVLALQWHLNIGSAAIQYSISPGCSA